MRVRAVIALRTLALVKGFTGILAVQKGTIDALLTVTLLVILAQFRLSQRIGSVMTERASVALEAYIDE